MFICFLVTGNKKRPLSSRQRAMQTLAVPPHIRHALADTTSLGADTPYRCNGRTRHIPTGPSWTFGRLLRDVFTHFFLSSLHHPEALFAGAEACYFFPSSLWHYQVVTILAEILRLSTIIFPKPVHCRQRMEARNFSASASSSSAPSSMVWDTWLPPVSRANSRRRCSLSSRRTSV